LISHIKSRILTRDSISEQFAKKYSFNDWQTIRKAISPNGHGINRAPYESDLDNTKGKADVEIPSHVAGLTPKKFALNIIKLKDNGWLRHAATRDI